MPQYPLRILYFFFSILFLCFLTTLLKTPSVFAVQTLNSMVGVPYKNFGFQNTSKGWVIWRWKKPQTPQNPPYGYNCSGFMIEATRRLYENRWTLNEFGARRNDPPDNSSDDLRYRFGYDLVKNILDLVGKGKVVKEEGYEQSLGFSPQNFNRLKTHMQQKHLYLIDVHQILPDKHRSWVIECRQDFHVAIAVPTTSGQVNVYESTRLGGSGIIKINWETFTAKYNKSHLWFYVVELPLPKEGEEEIDAILIEGTDSLINAHWEEYNTVTEKEATGTPQVRGISNSKQTGKSSGTINFHKTDALPLKKSFFPQIVSWALPRSLPNYRAKNILLSPMGEERDQIGSTYATSGVLEGGAWTFPAENRPSCEDAACENVKTPPGYLRFLTAVLGNVGPNLPTKRIPEENQKYYKNFRYKIPSPRPRACQYEKSIGGLDINPEIAPEPINVDPTFNVINLILYFIKKVKDLIYRQKGVEFNVVNKLMLGNRTENSSFLLGSSFLSSKRIDQFKLTKSVPADNALHVTTAFSPGRTSQHDLKWGFEKTKGTLCPMFCGLYPAERNKGEKAAKPGFLDLTGKMCPSCNAKNYGRRGNMDTLPIDMACPPEALAKLAEEAGKAWNTPPGVILGVAAIEGGQMWNYSNEQIQQYSQEGAQDPINCSPNFAGARGPMQFLENTWKNYDDSSQPIHSTSHICNILDAIYAASHYLHDSSYQSGGGWENNQEAVFNAAEGYYGRGKCIPCDQPMEPNTAAWYACRRLGMTYCEYVWSYNQKYIIECLGGEIFCLPDPNASLSPSSNLLDPGPSLAQTILDLRQIAKERDIPEELLLAKFWGEGGYFWDKANNQWCTTLRQGGNTGDCSWVAKRYWLGLRHWGPNGKVITSPTGSHGLAQIYVPVHPDYDVIEAEKNWKYNAGYGADYFRAQYDRHGNWANAVKSYHSPSEAEQGLRNVRYWLQCPPVDPQTSQPSWDPHPEIL